MNKALIFGIGTVLGAALGAVGAWAYTKAKYQKIADDEIASVKERFTCPRTEGAVRKPIIDVREAAEKAKNKPDVNLYAAVLKKNGYTDHSTKKVAYQEYAKKPVVVPDAVDEERATNERPYIISPEEFSENDSYESVSLLYYSDNVLTDDDNALVEDEGSVVGTDYMDHFGEFETDTVYIRNDQLRCDYEIMRDERRYSDLPGNERRDSVFLKPHQLEE